MIKAEQKFRKSFECTQEEFQKYVEPMILVIVFLLLPVSTLAFEYTSQIYESDQMCIHIISGTPPWCNDLSYVLVQIYHKDGSIDNFLNRNRVFYKWKGKITGNFSMTVDMPFVKGDSKDFEIHKFYIKNKRED